MARKSKKTQTKKNKKRIIIKFKNLFQKNKILFICLFFLFLTIYSTYLNINYYLKGIGLKFPNHLINFVILVIITSTLFYILFPNIKILKRINGYFIIACALSIIIMISGLHFLSVLYGVELPVYPQWYTHSQEEYDILQGNFNFSITLPLCESQKGNDYFIEGDTLRCTFNISVGGNNPYKFEYLQILFYLYNESTSKEEKWCSSSKNQCSFSIPLKKEIEYIYISPQFNNGAEQKNPLFTHFRAFDIKNKEKISEIEYNKLLLLIAIITAAFVTAWSSVYYAKRILQK